MSTPRFELLVNDSPRTDSGPVIWDHANNREVCRVSPEYGNLICLETVAEDGTASGFSGLADWMNALTTDALASEGIE